MLSCNDMKFTLVSSCCRTRSEMPWPPVFFFPQGLATAAMASFTRAGPMSRLPAFLARSGATRCASVWDPLNREPCSRSAFPEFPRAEQPSPSRRAEQGTGCFHSWVHWCFTTSSYFNLQVPLPVARCVLCHSGRLLKGCFTSVFLCSFVLFGFVLLIPAGKIILKH